MSRKHREAAAQHNANGPTQSLTALVKILRGLTPRVDTVALVITETSDYRAVAKDVACRHAQQSGALVLEVYLLQEKIDVQIRDAAHLARVVSDSTLLAMWTSEDVRVVGTTILVDGGCHVSPAEGVEGARE